jgi:hypothetical protein
MMMLADEGTLGAYWEFRGVISWKEFSNVLRP